MAIWAINTNINNIGHTLLRNGVVVYNGTFTECIYYACAFGQEEESIYYHNGMPHDTVGVERSRVLERARVNGLDWDKKTLKRRFAG